MSLEQDISLKLEVRPRSAAGLIFHIGRTRSYLSLSMDDKKVPWARGSGPQPPRLPSHQLHGAAGIGVGGLETLKVTAQIQLCPCMGGRQRTRRMQGLQGSCCIPGAFGALCSARVSSPPCGQGASLSWEERSPSFFPMLSLKGRRDKLFSHGEGRGGATRQRPHHLAQGSAAFMGAFTPPGSFAHIPQGGQVEDVGGFPLNVLQLKQAPTTLPSPQGARQALTAAVLFP